MANEYQTEQSCLSNSLTPVWGLQSVFVCCLFSRFFRHSISMFFGIMYVHMFVLCGICRFREVCVKYIWGASFSKIAQYGPNTTFNILTIYLIMFEMLMLTIFLTPCLILDISKKKKSLHKFFTETTSRSPVRMENVALAALWLC